MKRLVSGLLSIILVIGFTGCSGNGGPLPVSTETAPAKTQAAWEKDPRYHPSVGKVEITCGDVTFAPIENYLDSTEYRQGGWLAADGRSLMFEHEDRLMELEQKVTVVDYAPEALVKLTGGNGHLAYFVIHDKKYERIYHGLAPKSGGILQLPDDDRISYVCVVVSWAAELPPPGEDRTESMGMEYVFKVKYK